MHSLLSIEKKFSAFAFQCYSCCYLPLIHIVSITSWHKNSPYGSFFYSTIGGAFCLLSVFNGLVQLAIDAFLFLSFRQYCVQSLSVHSEHRRATLVSSENLSGYIIMQSSQISHTTKANKNSDCV